ncbi:MAG: polymer-forming cytoskeletal protein, partial [Thermoplasmata archaeon]|nr:polymer-forming cytoskeletal protein [Thermoplasmata archaeon]
EPAEPREGPEPPDEKEVLKHRPDKSGRLNISAIVEQAVTSAMEEVSQTLEETLGDELHEHMDDVNKHVRLALRHIGPKVDKAKRRVVIRSVGTVSLDAPIEEFVCSGSGKVESDLIAERVRIAGACKIEGRCECEEFTTSGSVKIEGDVQADTFQSSGSTKVEGNLNADALVVSGLVKVEGDIKSDAIKIGGLLSVEGWVRARSFKSKGRLRITRGLEADDIHVLLDSNAEVPVIRGTDILVKGSSQKGRLQAKTIEGDRVSVSRTRAKLVRGRDVRIGPQSRIDVVEADKVEVHETARVGKRKGRPSDGEASEEEEKDGSSET